MDWLKIWNAVDGGVAVGALLFVGWRIELATNRRWDDLLKLIDKLTNGES